MEEVIVTIHKLLHGLQLCFQLESLARMNRQAQD